MKNFKYALKAEKKYFVLDYKRATAFFIALLCLVCAILGAAYDAFSGRRDETDHVYDYTSEIEELELYFDVLEKREEADRPYDFSEDAVEGARNRLELLRRFVATDTDQDDYIDLSLAEITEILVRSPSDETRGSAFALNLSLFCGGIILIYSFITGALRGSTMFGEQRRTTYLCNIGRKELFASGITWDLSSLSLLFLITLITAFIGVACSQGRWFFFYSSSGIEVGSCFELVAGRLFAYFFACSAVYSVGLLSGLFRYRKIIVLFSLALIAALFAVGIKLAVYDDMDTQRTLLIPIAGLMFSMRGFRDATMYINAAMTAFVTAVAATVASAVSLKCDCR